MKFPPPPEQFNRILSIFILLVTIFVFHSQVFSQLTIRPTTWNVIGLDSNNETVGPNTFPVGAEVCNTSGSAINNLTANFIWDSTNTFINLENPTSTINFGTLAPNSCTGIYFIVVVTRSNSAYNATRRYRITVGGDGAGTVSTPSPRELYVEKLVSQNRNSILSISGPGSVYVGGTYTFTLAAKTATGGYEQLEAFLPFPSSIFQVTNIATTYTAPSGGTNDKFYADACGWDNLPSSSNYRSCVGPVQYAGGKAGGTISTTYTVKVLATGTSTLGSLVYDFSGSSYHYNDDFGDTTITVVASNPPDLTLSKADTADFTVGSSGTYSFTVNNIGGATSAGVITVTDTLPTGLTVNDGAAGGITASGTNAANWTCNSAALTGSPARQTITCTSSNAIAANGTSVFNFAVNVGVTTAVGTASITNTANVSGGGETNTSNNSSSDPTTVLAPDLTISKTDSGNSFTVDSLGNYTFTISNGGTAATSGTITVTDTLPAGLVVNGGTADAVTLYGTDASIWTCTSNSAASQTVTCTTTSVISTGGSSTFNFDVYVGPSTPTGTNSITNTAAVSGGGEVNTSNNSGSDSTTVSPEPAAPSPGTACSVGTAVNLLSTVPFSAFQDANSTAGITSTLPLIENASNYQFGTGPGNRIIVDLSWGWNNGEPSNVSTQATYTLRINGTDYARITTERNPIGRVATVVGLNGASVSDSTILVGSYPPSNYQQSYVTLPVSVTQIVSGSMIYASPGAAPGDDIGFRISTIYACSPAVTVSKTSNGPWAIGQTGTEYTLTATNAGAATTFGTTTVRDVLPPGVTANWTGTLNLTNSGLSWACTFSGQDVSCTTSDGLSNVSGSNTSQITVPINVTTATALGSNSITNYASIGGGGDPTNSGNAPTPGASCSPDGLCASHQTTVNSSDLTIAKSHSGNFTRGASGTYSISVGNGGTAATSGTITVSDSLPTGLTIPDGAVTLSGTDAPNWSCSAASNVITCTSTTVIAIGSSSSFSFSVNVSLTAADSVTNTVTVTGETEATVNNGNNSASDPTSLDSNPPNVELAKSCPAPLNCTTAPQLPGTDLTYKIVFRNTGGRGAANLVLVDQIPENTDYTVGSASANAATTGLVFAIEFSSDYDPLNPTFATWAYSPVSGGGGAVAGYDRNVKAIRWRVTSGTLSNVSPDNIGDISFGTRIR